MPGLTDKQHFALIPGTLRESDYNNGTKKERVVVQESIKIEVSVEDVDTVKEKLYKAFSTDDTSEYPHYRKDAVCSP